ncbi:MAG: VOC family protein [Oscillospiraceae bacterium]|nr:VOC family protein [Oscillospiraceae bacterium]
MMFKPLHHAISVADAEASAKWYNEIFGFTTVSDTVAAHLNARKIMMELDGFQLEIFQYLGDDAKCVPEDRLNPNDDLKTYGTKHVAYQVENLRELTAELNVKGVRIVKGPVPNGNDLLTFILDNSDVLIELMEIGGNK